MFRYNRDSRFFATVLFMRYRRIEATLPLTIRYVIQQLVVPCELTSFRAIVAATVEFMAIMIGLQNHHAAT